MKIVIIGGGISGCTAYLQLKKYLPTPFGSRHEYAIYEAYNTDLGKDREQPEGETHSATLTVGGGLGIGANGLNVLKRLDEELLSDIVKGGYTVGYSNLKNKNGRLLVRMESKTDEEGMNMVASSRHSLWECLRKRIPDEVIVNKRVAEVEARSEGRNIVRFADGSHVEADLVIGADGVKGCVKRALFPEADEDPFPPHYEGLVGIGGFIPSPQAPDVEKGSMNFIFGGNGFFGYFFSTSNPSDPNHASPYNISEPGDTVAWWSTYTIEPCPDTRSIDADDIVRQLRQRHATWGDPVVQKIINSVQVDSIYPTWTSPQLPTWERDGVVLVGDAAHALPPTSGQGSSQALEDVEAFALFLAHSLRNVQLESSASFDKQVIKTATKQYMELRQPRIKRILEQAQKNQNHKREMGLCQEWFMYLVLWVFGFFPSIISKPMKEVIQYNVAEHVCQVLATPKSKDI